MTFTEDLRTHVESVCAVVGAQTDASALPTHVRSLGDDDIVTLIEQCSAAMRRLDAVRVAATGVVAARSTRQAGHCGLSQTRGHRSPVSLVQDLAGTTRSDAIKQVHAGQSLFADAEGSHTDGTEPGDEPQEDHADAGNAPDEEKSRCASGPWHAPLGDALLGGHITTAQHDAILRNLGQPPDAEAAVADRVDRLDEQPSVEEIRRWIDEERRRDLDAWRTAATQLIDEARCRTVEDLANQARSIRDVLDPAGAQRRFDERYARRSFRLWRDRDGVSHGRFVFDDEAALWVRTALDTALAPRRGVRFIDPGEQERARTVANDTRSGDQLAHDLMIDLLRAGALAETDTVFGTRQAGIRLVVTTDAAHAVDAGEPAVAIAQDEDTTLPAWLATQHACDTGVTSCTLDLDGNPLDVGREARLFTPKQKLALAIRDGGCRWPNCDRPAHYCEAHHIDTWSSGGRTDVDRGILLCRYHHMQLHHHGWRITRERRGDFVLHPPGSTPPIPLSVRVARRYHWRTPPPHPRYIRAVTTAA